MRFFRVWCQRSILPWVIGWYGAPRTWAMSWRFIHFARSSETYEEPPLSRRPRRLASLARIIRYSDLPRTSNNIIQKGLAFVTQRSGQSADASFATAGAGIA